MSDQETNLSREVQRLEAENQRLRQGINQATIDLNQWIYTLKTKSIAEIHADLKELTADQPDQWKSGECYGF